MFVKIWSYQLVHRNWAAKQWQWIEKAHFRITHSLHFWNYDVHMELYELEGNKEHCKINMMCSASPYSPLPTRFVTLEITNLPQSALSELPSGTSSLKLRYSRIYYNKVQSNFNSKMEFRWQNNKNRQQFWNFKISKG